MPLIKPNEKLPEWSEFDLYKIIKLSAGERCILEVNSPAAILFFVEGECNVNGINYSKGNTAQFSPAGNQYVISAGSDSLIAAAAGRWKEEKGTFGIFTFAESSNPVNKGDATDYERNTVFDNHFHDCDEYWIILKGSGYVYSEGKKYFVSEGDCIATKTGDHHDFAWVNEEVTGIWVETTLKKQKRLGHLYNGRTHSPLEIIFNLLSAIIKK